MRIDMEYLPILVYNYAVVLSAAYIPVLSGSNDRFVLLGGGFVLALFWTGYFQYRIHPQLTEQDGTRSGD